MTAVVTEDIRRASVELAGTPLPGTIERRPAVMGEWPETSHIGCSPTPGLSSCEPPVEMEASTKPVKKWYGCAQESRSEYAQ